MKIYLVAIAKEYGFNILEYTYDTLEEAMERFEKYNDFYFRALVEVKYSSRRTNRKLIKKFIDGKEVIKI